MSEDNKSSAHSTIEFLKALYRLVQMSRIYDDNNLLVKDSLAQFRECLLEMAIVGNLNINLWRGRFYLDQEKVLYNRESGRILTELVDHFSRRGVGGLQCLKGFERVSSEDIMGFIRLLDASAGQKIPFDWLNQQLALKGLTWIKLTREKEEDEELKAEKDPAKRRREKAKKAYSLALSTIQDIEKTSGSAVSVRKARRLAQTIVDLVRDEKSFVLGLSTIKQFDDYTYTHSVNVSLLATALGRSIGLSKVSLAQLCVRALFHDLGKVEIPIKILHKVGRLSDEEREKIYSHPLIGVRKVLKMKAERMMKSKIILGPFEHHLNTDLTGYPKTHFTKRLSLLGKILRIADVYEALTADRKYRARSFTPDEALRKMWSEIGKSFDPILLKSFISMVGLYPIGSLVELNDGRRALVVDYPERAPKDRPVIRILLEEEDGDIRLGETISLSGFPGSGFNARLPRPRIIRSIHPSHLGVQVASFFMEEDKNVTSPEPIPTAA
ncbi:MAG TPA: HD domain-containing phosphohydrolase [Thermodesulfobacteriota bacterium]|nr:HD domain-containing phosphohydrolase [Thermodesulfobacteriota bacterium]